MTYDTIIIGGGIAGTSAAYNLVRNGVKTLLIDRHDTGRATNAGAGILSFPTLGLGQDELWFDFAMQCGGYYQTLVQQLQREQDGDTGSAVTGELIVAVDADELGSYEAKRRLMVKRQERFGQPAPGTLREISPGHFSACLFPEWVDGSLA